MGSYRRNKVVIRCFLTSDGTEPENYGLSKDQTPDLCYCKHNNKTQKSERKPAIYNRKPFNNYCTAPEL